VSAHDRPDPTAAVVRKRSRVASHPAPQTTALLASAGDHSSPGGNRKSRPRRDTADRPHQPAKARRPQWPAARKTTGTVPPEARPAARKQEKTSGRNSRQKCGCQEMERQQIAGNPDRCRPPGQPELNPRQRVPASLFPLPFLDPIPDRLPDPAETGLAQLCRHPRKRRYCTIRWTPRLIRTYVRKRFTGDRPRGELGALFIWLGLMSLCPRGSQASPSRGRRGWRGGYGEAGTASRRAARRQARAAERTRAGWPRKGRPAGGRRRRKSARKSAATEVSGQWQSARLAAGN
jgi:hypothetical protein